MVQATAPILDSTEGERPKHTELSLLIEVKLTLSLAQGKLSPSIAIDVCKPREGLGLRGAKPGAGRNSLQCGQ